MKTHLQSRPVVYFRPANTTLDQVHLDQSQDSPFKIDRQTKSVLPDVSSLHANYFCYFVH